MSNSVKKVIQTRTAVRRAALFASEKKAIDIKILDLRKITDFTDYFIICSGVVDVHVKTIHEHIHTMMSAQGWRSKHVEGVSGSKWILADYVHFVVHIFQPDARGYYAVEKLWGDAPLVTVKGVTDLQ